MDVAKSLIYFVLAGFLEIGGGYLIWIWLRDGKSFWIGLAGAILLAFYGIIPTLQHANFGRVYAAYGGVFVVLSILWGWQINRVVPDKFDLIGGAVVFIGVLIMMYYPRA